MSGLWSVNVSTVKYGDEIGDAGDLFTAVFASGSKNIMLPKPNLDAFLKKINKKCTLNSVGIPSFVCECKDVKDF